MLTTWRYLLIEKYLLSFAKKLSFIEYISCIWNEYCKTYDITGQPNLK